MYIRKCTCTLLCPFSFAGYTFIYAHVYSHLCTYVCTMYSIVYMLFPYSLYLHECIPTKSILQHRHPPWLSASIVRHIRKRNASFQKAKRTNLTLHHEQYRCIRNKITKMIRAAKRNHLTNLATKISGKPSKHLTKTPALFLL